MKGKLVYDCTWGRKGIDDFYIKFADGTIMPWPTEKEIDKWNREFPEPTNKQLDEWLRIYPELRDIINEIKKSRT